MANGDISNQLAGVGDGLDRFLEALDSASYKLGSNAALQATQARAAQKMKDQDLRVKKKLDKIEADHAKQLKAMQPVYKKLFTGIKDEIKQRTLLSKGMKDMSKSMTEFSKKALGGLGKAISVMGKAGILGAMVASVKLIADGLLRSDAAMAKLSGRMGMTRKELSGVRTEARGAQDAMSLMGITMEQSLETAGNLVQAFGSVKYVTNDLIQTTIKLESAYGLASDQAANLVETLTRANQGAQEFVDTVGAKAAAAGVATSLVMRDLASQTQKLSIYGERGNDAMINMAINLAKAGTSMKAFDGMESAFADTETIADNMGKITARWGTQLTKDYGSHVEMWHKMAMGGEEQAALIETMTKSLAANFSITEKGLVNQHTGQRVGIKFAKELAGAHGMELEAMTRIIKERDEYNELVEEERKKGAKSFKAWKASEKIKEDKRKKEAAKQEEIIKDQMTMVKRLTAIWDGLYSSLSEQLSLIFGVDGDTRNGIDRIGDALKSALDLSNFANDVNKDKGGWGYAIGKRVRAVFKDALAKVFPDFAKDVEGEGGGVGGFFKALLNKIQKVLVPKISNALADVFKHLFPKLSAEISAEGGGFGGFIQVMGDKIFIAIKDGIGKALDWAKNKVSEITGFSPEVVGGAGKAIAAVSGVVLAGKAALGVFHKTKQLFGMEASRENVGLTKDKAMWVKNVGGGGGLVNELMNVGGGGGGDTDGKGGKKPKGKLGRLFAPLKKMGKIFTKGGAFAKLFSIGGPAAGGIAKSLLRRAPILGAGLGALDVISGAVQRTQATTEEQKDIAEKQMATGIGGAGGAIVGGAIGTAILPGIGTAIGAALGGWLGGEGAGIVQENWDAIVSSFTSGIDKFTGWIDSGYETLKSIAQAFDWEKIKNYLKSLLPEWAADRLAMGASSYRGTAIVGEAGGEVVVSRSALRSGVGVSGAAASALQSIGVPGYQTGKRGSRVSGAVGTEGLIDALGSQELKRAYAQAVSAEIGQQQAAMNDYWRRYYEIKMKEAATRGDGGMGAYGGNEKGDGEKFADGVKYLFNEYPGLVDKSMQAGLSKAFKGEVPVMAGEMYKGVFSGMLAWSDGSSSKEALRLGVMAGMGAALQEGGTINKFMTEIKTGNSNLLYAMENGVEIETAKLDEMKKQEQMLLSKAYRARKAGDMEAHKAAWKQIDLLDKQVEQQQAVISNLEDIKKSTEGSETQAKLQYSATRGITSALDAAMATFMSGGSMGDIKEAALRGGVSQGVMGAGSAFFGTDKMDAARSTLGSSADVASRYSIAGQAQMGGAFGIPGMGDPRQMAMQHLGGLERGAQAQGYGSGNIPGFALGGIVDSPTPAMVGEAGAEVVAPMEELAPLGDAVAGEGGGPSVGGAGGGGGGGIEQILTMILQTNMQTMGGVMGIGPAVQGVSGAINAGIAGLTEMLTAFHAETKGILTAIGTLLGEIGTDISARLGKMIGHLSRIDTKVMRHPSSERHALKLTQGAAKGGGKEAASAAGKTDLTSPPVPGHMPGLTSVNAAKGGAKGARKGAQKAWDNLERAAKGKYVNSPTLMMVGEEGRGEIVIPTERIRKGLPINKGVANELGSIGVPGFANGGKTFSFSGAMQSVKDSGAHTDFGAGAATTFGDVFGATGDWKQAGTAGVGGGVEMVLNNKKVKEVIDKIPLVGPLINELNPGKYIGPLITKGLNKIFGLTGGQKKGRNRSLKIIEDHIKSRGLFDFGQPAQLKKWVNRAVGGKEKIPTEKNYKKLMDKLGGSKLLATAGVSPEVMIALATQKISGKKAYDIYRAMNVSLYGDAAGDKYMKAVAMPQLAQGGIVTKPTAAIVGEKGPEMVIPLHEQRNTNQEMIKELREQNKLMNKMIKTQVETGGATVRLDGRVIAESVGENFYDMGNGI